MRVRIYVDVKNQKQARDIELALQQSDVKAFALTVGALERLPDYRERDRALSFVLDYFADPKHARPPKRKAVGSVEA